MVLFLRTLVVAVLLFVCVAARADTLEAPCAGPNFGVLCATYDVGLMVGAGSIKGTITTRGDDGAIYFDNITAFNLTAQDGISSETFNSAHDRYVLLPPEFAPNALVATPDGLFFNFSQQNAILYFGNQDGGPYICFQNAGGNCDDHLNNHISFMVERDPRVLQLESGIVEIGVAATPEPSTLLLLSVGLLGALGVAFRRLV
jgi:hypothetical protein